MYDSPLYIFQTDINTKIDKQIEEAILTITSKAGIAIDRDKLIAALTNDEKRYEDAFQRGYSTRDNSIVRCERCKHGLSAFGNILCRKHYYSHKPDWFCADGEGKHDD